MVSGRQVRRRSSTIVSSHSAISATTAITIMAANTPMLLRAGLVEGRTDAGVLASGQVAGLLGDLPTCAELIENIVKDAESAIDRLRDVR